MLPAYPPPRNPDNVSAPAAVAEALRAAGWYIDRGVASTSRRPQWIASKNGVRYAAQVKALRSGRPDRALPQLALAILKARRGAQACAAQPLAVLVVEQASDHLWPQMVDLREQLAPDAGIGLLVADGRRRFLGAGLEALEREGAESAARGTGARPRRYGPLFSDLNQWLLKVLLAPELPEKWLHAPRARYTSGSQLAAAAGVSAMTVSRFLRSMQEEGFVEHSRRTIRLVRRQALFRRWCAAAQFTAPELPMRLLIPDPREERLLRVVARIEGCLGLFAAADQLGVGHVRGVPPYVYMRQMPARVGDNDWPGLMPAGAGEPVQLILRQAQTPQSLFRGAVRGVQDVAVADVIQVLLDVTAHPSRGAEQAEHLRQTALAGLLGDA